MWSWDYDSCKKCGTDEIPHKGQGLCIRCYAKMTELKTKVKKSERGVAADLLTEEYLQEYYINNNRSMADIARIAGCSRQYVNKKLKEYDFPPRDKKTARQLALKSGKIVDHRGLTYKHTTYNERFFKQWSSEMAYVLGVIYTDGCLSHGRKQGDIGTSSTVGTVSISQKDIVLLENIQLLIGTNSKIYSKSNNGIDNSLNVIDIRNDEIYDDLLNIGLTPNKSLTIKYPNVPEEFERDFIRGLWDGDGHVGQKKISFISGSKDFINKLYERLVYYKLNPSSIAEYKNGAFSFRINGGQPGRKKFFDFLYKGVDRPILYLSRKAKMFVY
ncbi:MAG: LAGLIDADG family homing endonuclease [Salinivirgaceae bacterium]|nr:LAGLIDADG family homing endonuclease [Salinivirgaceae bacterium]